MFYCLDSPLCIIVITTYSDIEPLSRSASLISRLRNAPYLLVSCYTFCLNLRQSSRGLCQVQVVIPHYSMWIFITISFDRKLGCKVIKVDYTLSYSILANRGYRALRIL